MIAILVKKIVIHIFFHHHAGLPKMLLFLLKSLENPFICSSVQPLLF